MIGEERPAKIVVTGEVRGLERALKAGGRLIQRFDAYVVRTFDRMVNKIRDRVNSIPGLFTRALKSLPGKMLGAIKATPGAIWRGTKGLAKGGFGVGKAGAGIAKGIGTGMLHDAGSRLMGGMASGIEETIDYERALTRFQIAGGNTAAQMYELRANIDKVSSATGISRNQLIGGSSAYLALTGDAAGAASQVAIFGKVALASGAEMSDVATAAAALKDNMKIDPADFEKAFSALIVQGKAGAIELKDLASELSGIAPLFTSFKGGTGMEGLATLGAALQAGRKGFGTASEAVTGLQALIVSLNRNAGKFTGVKIFDRDPKTGKKTLKDFKSIIDGISNSRLARDPTALTAAFGSVEAKRFYEQLVANRSMLNELEEASKNGGAVQADALAYQSSAAGKLEIAMNNIKLAISNAFTPELISNFASIAGDLAKHLGTVMGTLSDIGDWLSDRYSDENIKKKLDAETARGDAIFEKQQPMLEERRRFVAELTKDISPLDPNRDEKLLAVAAPLMRSGDREALATGRSILQMGTDANALQLEGERRAASRMPGQSRLATAPSALPPIVLQVSGETIATAVQQSRVSRREMGAR